MSCALPGEQMRADGRKAKQQNSPADRVGAVCCFILPIYQEWRMDYGAFQTWNVLI